MDVLLEALVDQVAKRWYPEAEHVRDDVGLHELRGISGQDDRNLHSGGPCTVDRNVERDAGARGILRSRGRDDEESWHSHQYGQMVNTVA